MPHTIAKFRRLGPGFTVALAVAAVAVVTLRAATPTQAQADFYYFDGAPVPLTRSQTEVVVRFSGGGSESAVTRLAQITPGLQHRPHTVVEGRNFDVLSVGAQLRIQGQIQATVQFQARVPVQGAARAPLAPQAGVDIDQLLQTLRDDPAVEFVAPVFHYPATGIRILPTDEVIVRLKPGDTEQSLRNSVASFGLTVDRPIYGMADQFVLRMTDGKGANALDVSRMLHDTGRFAWAEPNFLQEYEKFDIPNDPRFPNQWHLNNTGQGGGTVDADPDLPAAWDMEDGNGSIIVAVVDDGMDKVHEDLAVALFVNPGEIAANGVDDDGNGRIDDVSGWDFSNGDNNVTPTHPNDNHGTAVAGVAAARGNNAIGGTGSCRNCRILPVKIFEGGIATSSANLAAAITYSALFADVINNSWGGGSPSATIQAAIAGANTTGRGGKGSLVLFATGNSASGLTSASLSGFPAASYGFQFIYSKNVSGAGGSDTAWIPWTILPGGSVVDFSGGIPAGWTTGGNANWTSVTDPTHSDEGVCLTKTGKAGTILDNQTSYVQVLNKAVGAGTWTTYLWVSSAAGDGLRILLDQDNNGTFEADYFGLISFNPAVTMSVAYPAAHPESVAVGASSNFDCRSHYSQFGPELAFVAPSGAGPRNLFIDTTDRMGAPGYDPTNYTTTFGGTSSATPLASGIAALVLSKNPSLTRTAAVDLLKLSADKVGPEPYVSGRNDRYGHGRLNAHEALLDTPAWTGPGAFNKIAPTNGAVGQPLATYLTWGAASGATSYEYCIDTINDNLCNTSWTNVGNVTGVQLAALPASSTRYWHVRATNASGMTYSQADFASFWAFTTGVAAVPFGQVDTPSQNAAGVQGSLGFTGWALDETGVTKVEIFRNCLGGFDAVNCQTVLGQSLVYIGDASFVAGARPDVEAAYPTHPFKNRAGWGYLMLTLMLPHVTNSQPYGGQGPIVIYAIATDTNANKKILGRTTADSTPTSMGLTNDTLANPVGAIDTPGQGQTISGIFNNFGWALTPDSNTIGGEGGDILMPLNGSTINVYIDALPPVAVAYNQCRGNVGNPPPGGVFCNDDVSNIFGNTVPAAPLTPRASNPTKWRNLDAARGPIGAYTFNTALLSDGLHTIQWGVTDSMGRAAGLGSRYFTTDNIPGTQPLSAALALTAPQVRDLGEARKLDGLTPVTKGVWGRTGFSLDSPWTQMRANDDGTYSVRLPEMGRLEMWLGPVEAGYMVANGTLRELPVGSTLQESQFGWMPPPGYIGPYRLTFVRGGERIDVTVTVVEKPRVVDGEAQVRMQLDAAVIGASGVGPSLAERGVRLDGWAFDPQAAIGAGIGAVHVWATRTDGWSGAPPVFLGAATLDQARPDAARSSDGAPSHAGFSLSAALAPGRYVLTAYVWNERTARWEDARSVTVFVR